MNKEELLFGDIVVIEDDLIGVVVKCWISSPYTSPIRKYDVYVRETGNIKEYEESKVQRYRVRHKCLNEEELEYQNSHDFDFFKNVAKIIKDRGGKK